MDKWARGPVAKTLLERKKRADPVAGTHCVVTFIWTNGLARLPRACLKEARRLTRLPRCKFKDAAIFNNSVKMSNEIISYKHKRN
jgi:hypothetical protein